MSRKTALAFIGSHIPAVAKPLADAQAYAASDPAGSLAKSRLVAETVVKTLGRGARLTKAPQETAESYLRRVAEAARLPREVADAFHRIRILGNAAVHENRGSAADAGAALDRLATIGAWLEAAQAKPRAARARKTVPSQQPAKKPARRGRAGGPPPRPRASTRPKAAGPRRKAPLAERGRGPTIIRRLFWITAVILVLFLAFRWLPHLAQSPLRR